MLGTKISTLRAWACRRMGPARTKAGKRVLYRKEAVADWLKSREVDFAACRSQAYRDAPAVAI